MKSSLSWEKIGNRYGKEIEIMLANVESLSDVMSLLDAKIATSTLMLDFSLIPDKKTLKSFMHAIFRLMPLALSVSGKGMDDNFDLMLQVQGDIKPKKHTMTYPLENKDWFDNVKSFIYNSWPSDERWNEWKYCLILSIGRNPNDYHKVVEKLRKNIKLFT